MDTPMEINALKAFVAVAESQSFSLAAERLFITQPAVSKRIRGLEEELGQPLFDRVGRRVRLTEAGELLLPRARQLLRELDEIRASIANLDAAVSGHLPMATSHHIGLHRLPPVLGRFVRTFPAVELDIRFMDSESACRQVADWRLDLAVVTLSDWAREQLVAIEIWPDPLLVTVERNHPLAQLESPALEDLLAHPAVLPDRGTWTRDLVEQAIARAGGRLRVAMSTNYLETLAMLVSVGFGWSLLPEALARRDGFVVLEIEALRLSRSLGVVHHPERSLPRAARAMLETLQQEQTKRTG